MFHPCSSLHPRWGGRQRVKTWSWADLVWHPHQVADTKLDTWKATAFLASLALLSFLSLASLLSLVFRGDQTRLLWRTCLLDFLLCTRCLRWLLWSQCSGSLCSRRHWSFGWGGFVACIWHRFFVIWHFVLLWFRFLLHSCGCRSFNRWSFRSFLLNTLLATAKQLAHYSLPDVGTTNQCRKETNQGHLLPFSRQEAPNNV